MYFGTELATFNKTHFIIVLTSVVVVVVVTTTTTIIIIWVDLHTNIVEHVTLNSSRKII
jgi:hypothetical protein